MRERASEASKLMGEAFSQSKAIRPYSPAEARKLTETGRQHKQTMEIFNKKASDMIFKGMLPLALVDILGADITS